MQIRTETKVGAFIIAALAVLVGSAIYFGFWTCHQNQYNSYTVLFQDVSGLISQAEVKIAGVRVGWVDQIRLVENHQAEVRIMVDQRYQLYQNAAAEICQDGLLGAKCIDLSPGNLGAGKILPGTHLYIRGQKPTSIDELLQRFGQIANNIESVSTALKDVITNPDQKQKLEQVVERVAGAANAVESVARKVDEGGGLFGRLVNDGKLYDDICRVSCSFRDATDAYDRMGLVVDSHFEAMTRRDDEYDHKNAKGYFGVRLHTSDEWFYLFQMVSSEEGGVVSRNELHNRYYNSAGDRLTDQDLSNLTGAFIAFPALVKETRYARNTLRYSYQIGRVFGKAAVRFGAFEDFFGIAADLEVLNNDYCRWVTTMECFDFRGQNHLDDRRPHFKWLNRFFLFRNVYFDFGVDDFVSKASVAPYWGFGIRFGDDDLKVLFSRFGLPAGKT